jgi:hypothetical protein
MACPAISHLPAPNPWSNFVDAKTLTACRISRSDIILRFPSLLSSNMSFALGSIIGAINWAVDDRVSEEDEMAPPEQVPKK